MKIDPKLRKRLEYLFKKWKEERTALYTDLIAQEHRLGSRAEMVERKYEFLKAQHEATLLALEMREGAFVSKHHANLIDLQKKVDELETLLYFD